jgi:hypothetical protein
MCAAGVADALLSTRGSTIWSIAGADQWIGGVLNCEPKTRQIALL